MRIKASVLLFILCLLSACTSPQAPTEPDHRPVTFRIRGTVSDSTTGGPVAAFVALDILFGFISGANTNSEGHYTIESAVLRDEYWKESDLRLDVEATGYKSKSIVYKDENHVRLTEEWQTIDIQLEPESGSNASLGGTGRTWAK